MLEVLNRLFADVSNLILENLPHHVLFFYGFLANLASFLRGVTVARKDLSAHFPFRQPRVVASGVFDCVFLTVKCCVHGRIK